MLIVLQWVFWIVGLGLDVLLTITLWQRWAKEFPALFAYITCLLLTTTIDIWAYLIVGKGSYSFRTYYWSAELIRQSALFAVVVALAMHILPEGRRTSAFGRMTGLAGAAIWVGSVAICYSGFLNTWMSAVVRNLSFFTGVLNLLVWFMFARVQPRDTLRLMIAGGLGLQMTGDAIGQAIRQLHLSTSVSLAGGIFMIVTHFLCLFIWWRAFNLDPGTQARSATAGL